MAEGAPTGGAGDLRGEPVPQESRGMAFTLPAIKGKPDSATLAFFVSFASALRDLPSGPMLGRRLPPALEGK